MTAAALSRAMAGSGRRITLVESYDIGTVGVGEATIPTIHWFNQIVGFDERQFMAETKATYKLGIEFQGWNGHGTAYLHPFGTYGPPGDGVMFLHRLIRARIEGMDAPTEQFSLTAQAARARRFAHPVPDRRSLLSTLGYAFHFDAGLYAGYLRKLAEAAGVRRIEGKVARIERDAETGLVAGAHHRRRRDCRRGLLRRLLGLRRPAHRRRDAGRLRGLERMASRATVPGRCRPRARRRRRPIHARLRWSAGWRWRIPLQHRTGNGYVFSSRYQDEQTAREALLAALGEQPLAEPRLLRFRPGRRRRSWAGNVVAIGLSSGFLEPLESTSIHLIQSGIAKLLALFPRHGRDTLVAEQFNRIFAQEMLDVRDFLIMHYKLTTGRTDLMWQYCQTMTVPDSLAYRFEQFLASGRIMLSSDELFRDASWFAVMDGQGLRPRDYNPMVDTVTIKDIIWSPRAGA